jgi:D-arabinose 1-dehydrogenase-like Zn-dependent alcohol dehydrogenase
MKAAVVKTFGTPLNNENLPKPQPGPSQVVVKIESKRRFIAHNFQVVANC